MTGVVLVYGVLLLVAVIVSGLARRTVVSTAVLFLLGGFLAGPGVTDLMRFHAEDRWVRELAELALFAVLFSDGMEVSLPRLRTEWNAPLRALLLGMPATFVVAAVMARSLLGLPWTSALLLAAVLAPTDPVFASALVDRPAVPSRLRSLLNIESGLNDGLALPAVVGLLASVSPEHVDLWRISLEVLEGVVVGVGLAAAVGRLMRYLPTDPTDRYEPLSAAALALIVFTLSKLTGANLFLAAFTAGITVHAVAPRMRESFRRFGVVVVEVLKLLAVLAFGALITPRLFMSTSWQMVVLVVLVVLVARPVPVTLALIGSDLPLKERAVAGWFGPKGFASVIYALMVLQARFPESREVFHVVAVTVAASIVLHSSTDALAARLFRQDRSRRGSRTSVPPS